MHETTVKRKRGRKPRIRTPEEIAEKEARRLQRLQRLAENEAKTLMPRLKRGKPTTEQASYEDARFPTAVLVIASNAITSAKGFAAHSTTFTHTNEAISFFNELIQHGHIDKAPNHESYRITPLCFALASKYYVRFPEVVSAITRHKPEHLKQSKRLALTDLVILNTLATRKFNRLSEVTNALQIALDRSDIDTEHVRNRLTHFKSMALLQIKSSSDRHLTAKGNYIRAMLNSNATKEDKPQDYSIKFDDIYTPTTYTHEQQQTHIRTSVD